MTKATWKNWLSVACLVALLVVAAGSEARADLVGYWNFDEGSGPTAYDLSGQGNNGTVVGSPSWVPGVAGTALLFDGATQFVNCGNDSSLSLTGDMTISAFVRLSQNVDGRTLISKHYDNEYDLTFWGNTLIYYHGPPWNIGNAGGFGPALQPGTLYHLAITRNAATKTVTAYITNKATQALSTGTFVYNTPPYSSTNILTIGRRSQGGGFLPGMIDDVRIYDEVLSAQEIFALSNIPEPSALVMILGAGAVALLGRACRRRRLG